MMSTRAGLLSIAAGLALAVAGCFSVKAPREINVGGSSRPEPVDSSRIPATASHEEARAELHKAYAYIQWLERKNAELEEDKADCKRERDKYKRQRDEYKDRLEDREDD
jgi:hypothetical protein